MNIYKILSSKSHNPHYLIRYIKFINSRPKHEKSSDLTESHHICPKSNDLFPEFKSFKLHPWNKINLTLKEHYVAHLLLWKAYGGSQARAFWLMSTTRGIKNSRTYVTIKNEHRRHMRTNNPNADGQHTKQIWVNATDSRRKQQSEIMKIVNGKKKKPKEIRHYHCSYCEKELEREEFSHHLAKDKYYLSLIHI